MIPTLRQSRQVRLLCFASSMPRIDGGRDGYGPIVVKYLENHEELAHIFRAESDPISAVLEGAGLADAEKRATRLDLEAATDQQIASELGQTVGTVKKELSRARSKLARRFGTGSTD